MSAADTVSIVVAAVAVAATVVLVLLLVMRRRSDHDDSSRPSPEPAMTPPTVSIRLLRKRNSGLVWRLDLAPGSPTATIDILTYRPHGSVSSWCHELMDAPLSLGSKSYHDLDGPSPSPATTFDVCLGWTTNGTPESRYVTVHADTAD